MITFVILRHMRAAPLVRVRGKFTVNIPVCESLRQHHRAILSCTSGAAFQTNPRASTVTADAASPSQPLCVADMVPLSHDEAAIAGANPASSLLVRVITTY